MLQISWAQPLTVEVRAKTEWLSLSETSAIRVRRALSPTTGKPYQALPQYPTLSREFGLPHRKLVLGEPLLVEYRVSDSEESSWKEPVGGRYRGSGRDDNFRFFLRHEDGTWVPDPYGKTWDMGGISVEREVGPERTFSYWLPIQRWCRLTRPGKYRLYCIRWVADYTLRGRDEALNESLPDVLRFDTASGIVDAATGEAVDDQKYNWQVVEEEPATSPISLPKDLLEEMRRRDIPEDSVATFAEFQFEALSEPPTLQKWKDLAEGENLTWPDNRSTAARIGLWYLPQTSQLELLKSWLGEAGPTELQGLAMNPNPEAVKLLMTAPPEQVLDSLLRLNESHRVLLKPWLKSLLRSGEDSPSSRARQILEEWEKRQPSL